MRPLTFIVGTGRTGSTALSRILGKHRQVLSLNELFVSLNGPAALPEGAVTGERFWRMLADPHPVFDAMMRRGTSLPEFLYTRRPGRYSAETGIPALSLMVLPHLSDDPDGLLDELGRHIVSWPARPAAHHHEALFELLADQLGRDAVVERSGHSLTWVPMLRRAFPRARFVHMHRHGPDCALSMSRHPGYRAAGLAQEILERTGAPSVRELTDAHLRTLPDGLAEVVTSGFVPASVMDRPAPVAVFGSIWSRMITEGVGHLANMPATSRMTLCYEDLLKDPERELTRLASFIGAVPDPEWLDAGRRLLDAGRPGASRRLPPEELSALEERCLPGVRALSGLMKPEPGSYFGPMRTTDSSLFEP
ncbi:sulfotransferase [Streptomyces sp. NPDC050619]|uniref:sulfotransferase family protein n=1 Tax=Streptomyces sp. NPDC050619 TaxID=3157214 RepID=UPI003430B892